jgi:hypothetical protein
MAGISENSGHAGDINQKEADAGILASHGISLDVPGTSESGQPPIVHHLYALTRKDFLGPMLTFHLVQCQHIKAL